MGRTSESEDDIFIILGIRLKTDNGFKFDWLFSAIFYVSGAQYVSTFKPKIPY